MSKRQLVSVVIVNVAIGDWYPKGQRRLIRSLAAVGYGGSTMMTTSVPEGCPQHHEVPYAFKTHALVNAMERMRPRVLIWSDAANFAVRSLEPLVEFILERGYMMIRGGNRCGEWCCDAALPTIGLSREELMEIPSLQSGLVGFDLQCADAVRALYDWHAFAQDRNTFKGPRCRDDGFVSDDPRVRGHRQDQTALEVVAHRLGLRTDVQMPRFLAYNERGKPSHPDTIFLNEGQTEGLE